MHCRSEFSVVRALRDAYAVLQVLDEESLKVVRAIEGQKVRSTQPPQSRPSAPRWRRAMILPCAILSRRGL